MVKKKTNVDESETSVVSFGMVDCSQKSNGVEIDRQIQRRILLMRGTQVMLDRDLAELYGVLTKNLNKAVKRNIGRFPEDFMFQLTKEESLRFQSGTLNVLDKPNKTGVFDTEEILRFQIGTTKDGRGGSRYQPYAFTENGIAMLSSVLKSQRAIDVNIQIMRAFTQMRKVLMTSAGVLQRLGAIEVRQIAAEKDFNAKFETVFDALGRGNLLPNGLLGPEAEFDALRFVTRLVESARKEIVLIDPYSDASTLEVLTKKAKDVKVRLVCKATNWSKPTPIEIAKFNKQYKGLEVLRSDNFHDRFVIIDGAELYNLGSSVNSLGRRLTTYTSRDPKEIAKILAQI